MIPALALEDWANTVAWANPDQLEQDLVLARQIVEIANDPYLGDELVFRGGTCLHKLHLSPGLRYSEDLDYVRRSAGGIGELLAALRNIGDRLGMKVGVDISKYPKAKFRAPFESGTGPMRIKVEVNTYERSPARPLTRVPFSVSRHGSPAPLTSRHSTRPNSSQRSSERCTNDRRAAISSISGSRSPASPSHPMRS